MPSIRDWPQPGSQRTAVDGLQRPLAQAVVIDAMNHWSVARKITGFLHRQQCG